MQEGTEILAGRMALGLAEIYVRDAREWCSAAVHVLNTRVPRLQVDEDAETDILSSISAMVAAILLADASLKTVYALSINYVDTSCHVGMVDTFKARVESVANALRAIAPEARSWVQDLQLDEGNDLSSYCAERVFCDLNDINITSIKLDVERAFEKLLDCEESLRNLYGAFEPVRVLTPIIRMHSGSTAPSRLERRAFVDAWTMLLLQHGQPITHIAMEKMLDASIDVMKERLSQYADRHGEIAIIIDDESSGLPVLGRRML